MNMLRGSALALALAAALLGAGARADTLEDLRAQAAQPLTVSIEAYGRQIELEVQAEIADVDAMGVYLARQVSVRESTGLPAVEQLPEKRRGIALRRRDPEAFAPDALPEDYRAFGHPQTAREAIDSAWALLGPYAEPLDGVVVKLEQVTGVSPHYFYDKNAGEWGEVAVSSAVGSYRVEYDVSLYGAPMLDVYPFYRDWEAHRSENAYIDSTLSVRASAYVEVTEQGEPCISIYGELPDVQQTLAEAVDFAPLESVWATLCRMAEEGHLRQAFSLRLCYLGFCYGERPEDFARPEAYLIKPVWVLNCEAYQDPDMQAHMMSGELWWMEENIVVDAQTGELIERARVVSYP